MAYISKVSRLASKAVSQTDATYSLVVFFSDQFVGIVRLVSGTVAVPNRELTPSRQCYKLNQYPYHAT